MKPLRISLVVLAAVFAGRVPAFCQAPSSPSPSPAIFGGAAPRDASAGGLDALVELFQAYDDNVLAGQTAGTPNRPLVDGASGMYSGLGVAAQYNAIGGGTTFRSWLNTAARYYPDFNGLFSAAHQVGLNLTHPLTRRLTFQIGTLGAYSPQYAMQLFPTSDQYRDAVIVDEVLSAGSEIDFAVIPRKSLRYSGDSSLSYRLTGVSTLSVRAGYAKSEFDDRPEDLEVKTAGIRFNHRFSRNASFRVGYLRQEGNYVVSERRLIENITLGVDYTKPLSRSRRTVLHFSTGSVAADDVDGRRFQATGSASIVHHIGRTWSARGDYNRSMRHLEGFDRPIFSDAASVMLGGLITRRIDAWMSAAYFTGTIGLRSDAPRFDSYAAQVRLRTALSRRMAAYVEYRFYHYRFESAIGRPLGVPPVFDRHGARVGMSLFVPLIN